MAGSPAAARPVRHRPPVQVTRIRPTLPAFAPLFAPPSEDTAPIPWTGKIPGRNNLPAPGTKLVPFARPGGSDVSPTHAPLRAAARTTTNGAGHYALRSGQSEALRAV